jgi:hypothetical protein
MEKGFGVYGRWDKLSLGFLVFSEVGFGYPQLAFGWRHGSPQRYPIMFLSCSLCIPLHHMQAFLSLSYYSDAFLTKERSATWMTSIMFFSKHFVYEMPQVCSALDSALI